MKRHARGSQQADALNLKAPNELSKAKPKKSEKPKKSKKPKKPKIECPGCEGVHATFTPSTLHAGGQSAYTHDCHSADQTQKSGRPGTPMPNAFVG
jgi:hypothetical protein